MLQKKERFFFFNTFLGKFLDIETLFMLRTFSNKLGFNNVFSSINNLSIDFREYYSFNTTLNSLNFSDVCLLIGTNLRLELPLLNLRVRNLFLKKGTLVYSLGYYSNFNFYIKHLGVNYLVLVRLLEGVH